jgi:hypothetical protein
MQQTVSSVNKSYKVLLDSKSIAKQTNPWSGLWMFPTHQTVSSVNNSYWDTKSSTTDKPLVRTVNVPHASDCLICEQLLLRYKEQPCRQTPGQDCECSPRIRLSHPSDCLICEQVLLGYKEQHYRQTPGQDCECSPRIRLSHLWTTPTEIQRAALYRQTPGQDCECSPRIRLSHLWTTPTESSTTDKPCVRTRLVQILPI